MKTLRTPLVLSALLLSASAGCGEVGELSGGSAGSGGASAAASTAATMSSSSGSTSTGYTGPAPMPKGCITDVSAGHHLFPCLGGISYDVEIPPACAAGGCGLVVDMHGYTMNAAQEDLATGMRAQGDQHGYVVVQPNAGGVPPSWDQLTDAPAVFAFLTDAATALSTDPKRAHVMGFSQGGGMTWRLVCSHADFFASASPMSGIEGCEFIAPDAPTREVPLLMVHGHKDNLVNFTSVAIPLRDAALAFWKYGAGSVFAMDAAHTATEYQTAAGTVFEFWEHDYTAGSAILGGHCSPGGSDVGPSPLQFGCQDKGEFDYGQTVMAFFIVHPMK
jgi:polyhydroxybutyrate depolymerase